MTNEELIIAALALCLLMSLIGWTLQTRRANWWKERAYEELRKIR